MDKKSPQSRLLKFTVCFLVILALLCAGIYALKWAGGRIIHLSFSQDTPTESTETETVPAQSEPAESETVPTQSEPTEPEKKAEIIRATITVTGDVMTHKPVINSGFDGTSYNFDSIFSYITDYVSGADFAVANLETTFAGTDNGNVYSGFPQFNCPDDLADALKNAGFDMLLTANNHSSDTGAYGMTRTLEVVADRGLLSLGTTQSAEEPDYLVQDINGIKVGMICYTYGVIDSETGRKSINGIPIGQSLTENINIFDYNKLERFYSEMETYLADMKEEGAEITVLFIHWGNEYQLRQNSYQTAIAQKMCDLGVDVIAGGHPHVVEPVDLLTSGSDPEHKTLCVYSLGNAVSNQRAAYMNLNTGHTEDGMLFSFTLAKYPDGQVFLESAEILPTWVCLRSGKYDILPLDKEITNWKAAFDLGDSALQDAEDSYDRTLALIGPGMEKVNEYLEEGEAARDTESTTAG